MLFCSDARSASGADFRLSFLDDKAVLAETCQLLNESGCSADSVASFKKLVEHHNRKGNRVDKSRFSAPQSGFYEFHDVADFTNRLRTLFHWTPSDHSLAQDTFTCFDVACLLLHGAGCGAPDFEKDLSSKGIVLSEAGPAAFRSGYSWALFPEKGYERLVGKPRSAGETQLILSIRAIRGVTGAEPMSEEAWRAAFATFTRGLKEGGFVFPRKFQLGLGFYVIPGQRYFHADHVFLCFPRSERFICLEKNGSPGPYVRVEFESEADMARYMSAAMLEDAKNPKLQAYRAPVIVSLNDRIIGVYP